MRPSSGFRAAKEFEESGQCDPYAHAANDQLKHIHRTKISEGWPLGQIKESENGKNQRDEDTRPDKGIDAAHRSSSSLRILSFGVRAGPEVTATPPRHGVTGPICGHCPESANHGSAINHKVI